MSIYQGEEGETFDRMAQVHVASYGQTPVGEGEPSGKPEVIPEAYDVPPKVPIEWCKQAIAQLLGYNPSSPSTWPMETIEQIQRAIISAGDRELHHCWLEMVRR